mmetsp:Transcript_12383/g.29068  ORF Transcript_12383/g.29068 Transcript_12383/m.29068 type:complete len:202 (-) Transcript_12383:441-1046(-)
MFGVRPRHLPKDASAASSNLTGLLTSYRKYAPMSFCTPRVHHLYDLFAANRCKPRKVSSLGSMSMRPLHNQSSAPVASHIQLSLWPHMGARSKSQSMLRTRIASASSQMSFSNCVNLQICIFQNLMRSLTFMCGLTIDGTRTSCTGNICTFKRPSTFARAVPSGKCVVFVSTTSGNALKRLTARAIASTCQMCFGGMPGLS